MNTTLCEGIDWVGYVDWHVRDFHGYQTDRGATYNAYIIRDEVTVLIDTVKAPFSEKLLRNIKSFTDLDKVDFVVCNHAEPDHSGSLPVVMKAMPDATLVCTAKCEKTLTHHYDTSGWKFRIVKTGDKIPLGSRSMEFIETPMAHWPESMFTYIPEEKILFSMDAFGQHYATSQRFDDEVKLSTAIDEAKIYYANILMPFPRQCRKALEDAGKLEIEMIAPSHGIIWRSHIEEIIEKYSEWANNQVKPKVVVIYDTMWNSTGDMAETIYEGANRPGVEVVLIHIRRTTLTRIATEILDASAVAFGSATLNRDMMPMASAVMTYLKGLRAVGKVGFSFGSHGWGRGGPEAIEDQFNELKWGVLRKPIKCKYAPTPEVLDECRAAGRELAEWAFDMGSVWKADWTKGLEESNWLGA